MQKYCDFPVDYYKDEVRNGFYIPTAIKQAWAANLSVLSEIDRICEKYKITYFADWGSMLGAVRHGGYVPWDDDLDICMKRSDYDRFKEVADKELPKEFAIHDFRRKEDHWLFLSRVVNCNQICFDEEHLKKYHNFPYIAVVDIFVKDYLFRDEKKEQERISKIKHLIASADGIVDGSFRGDVEEQVISGIEKDYGVLIDRRASARDKGIAIYTVAEKLMASVPESEADNIGQMFPMVLKGDRGVPKDYYDDVVRIPFENTTIPVPARYHEMLSNRYGNYLIPKKIWDGHNYPFFEGQRDNLKAVADFELPEFTFKREMLLPVDRESTKDESLKGMSVSVEDQLNEMNEQLAELFLNNNYEAVSQFLPELQQFVVDYGTLVEGVRGEQDLRTINVVSAIQNYCDGLFEIYEYINNDASYSDNEAKKQEIIHSFLSKSGELIETIDKKIIKRKEVLFITTGNKEWNSFKDLYQMYFEDEECDVYTMPIPVFFKDIYGRVLAGDADNDDCAEGYPENVRIVSWKEYNIALHRPETIYIQNPYDGENPCLTIPPQYYASNIRRYTDDLIYIPPFKTGEFSLDDYTDMYNTKHYVTAPALIYADEVIVQSDNIKDVYVEVLTRFAGADTKSVWEDKIKTSCETHVNDSCSKKRLLYCLGLNELSEHNDIIIECVKKRIELIKSNGDNIDFDLMLFPDDRILWDSVDRECSARLFDEISNCMIIHENENEKIIDRYDAYYGSASPMALQFLTEGKPVMIADYDVC